MIKRSKHRATTTKVRSLKTREPAEATKPTCPNAAAVIDAAPHTSLRPIAAQRSTTAAGSPVQQFIAPRALKASGHPDRTKSASPKTKASSATKTETAVAAPTTASTSCGTPKERGPTGLPDRLVVVVDTELLTPDDSRPSSPTQYSSGEVSSRTPPRADARALGEFEVSDVEEAYGVEAALSIDAMEALASSLLAPPRPTVTLPPPSVPPVEPLAEVFVDDMMPLSETSSSSSGQDTGPSHFAAELADMDDCRTQLQSMWKAHMSDPKTTNGDELWRDMFAVIERMAGFLASMRHRLLTACGRYQSRRRRRPTVRRGLTHAAMQLQQIFQSISLWSLSNYDTSMAAYLMEATLTHVGIARSVKAGIEDIGPFAALQVARELVLRTRECFADPEALSLHVEATGALLVRCIDACQIERDRPPPQPSVSVDPHNWETAHKVRRRMRRTATAQYGLSLLECPVFITGPPAPLFFGEAWYNLGIFLRHCSSNAHALQILASMSTPEVLLAEALPVTSQNLAALEPYACFISAIEVNRGSHPYAWELLADEMTDATPRPPGVVRVCGRYFDVPHIYAEAIRCLGGYTECRRADLWASLARSMPSDGDILIDRIASGEWSSHTMVSLDQKRVWAMSLAHDSSRADVWVSLSGCLDSSLVVTCDGRTATVSREDDALFCCDGMKTRLSCLAVALSIQRRSAEVWLQIAMAVEDDAVRRALMPWCSVDDDVVWARIGTRTVSKEEALRHALEYDPASPRTWYAVGEMLWMRQYVRDRRAGVLLEPTTPILAQLIPGLHPFATAPTNDDVQATDTLWVTSEVALQQAIALDATFARYVRAGIPTAHRSVWEKVLDLLESVGPVEGDKEASDSASDV